VLQQESKLVVAPILVQLEVQVSRQEIVLGSREEFLSVCQIAARKDVQKEKLGDGNSNGTMECAARDPR
jgi:hypothetical protein